MKTKTDIITLEILSAARLGAGPMAREKSQGFLILREGRKMKIDYEAHEVFDPDFLSEQLGFVAGVLELCELAGDNLGRDTDGNLNWVLCEANNRVRDILGKLHKAVIEAMPPKKVSKAE